MTLTYDADIVTSGAGVKPNGDNLTDEEIQQYLDDVSSWGLAVPPVLRSLANHYATHARMMQLDDYREDLREIVKQLREQAVEWEQKEAATSGAFFLDVQSDAEFYFGNKQYDTTIDDQREID
jgi:hypothetical protein